MALTSPDSLRSPDPTDPYNLVSDLAVSMGTVQTALERRANSYKGTSAQRIAFTTAPEGVHWQDTDGDKAAYIRQAGAWVSTNASGVFTPASGYTTTGSYSLTKNEFGVVTLLMRVTKGSGNVADNDTIGTLATGFRPGATWYVPASFASVAAGGAVGISPAGVVTYRGAGPGTTFWVSCTFSV